MNAILHEDGVYRLYFNNFRDFGKVFRASSCDGTRFSFDGPVLEVGAVVNDVKKFVVGGETHYLMALHMNTDRLWYSLSRDGMSFAQAKELAKNQSDADRYMVAVGWVVQKQRVLGFLYGAGAVPELNRNRIFGRWLQKKVVFVGDDGTRCEPAAALGPDRQIISVPSNKTINGHFTIYAEDGSTVIPGKCPGTLTPGAVYMLAKQR